MRVIALIIIGVILFFTFLGFRGLCEPDEGRYAEISREMRESGDWLTPRLNYIKHFHKPPLVYWLVNLSFLFFGMNEFTARLPVAILGVIGMVITYLLSIRMGRDKTASFFSSLVLVTTLQFFIWTQVLSSDMVFGFFILLAFYGFWTRSYLFYFGVAMAFMIKGPVGVIVPCLVIGVYILVTKEGFFEIKKFLLGGIMFFIITSPWFIYVCNKNPGLFRYFLFFQSLDRLFTDIHGRGGNILYFIPVLIIGGLPWILFMPRVLRIKDSVSLFLFLWLVIPIIFFSFSGSKLPGYILPVYPAMAIFTGGYLGKKRFYKLFSGLFIVYLVGTGILPRFEDRLGDNLSIRKPASIIKKFGDKEDKIVNFRCFLQGLPFYLGKRIILVEKDREIQFEEDVGIHKDYLIPNLDEFFENLKDGEHFWCFTKLEDYSDLKKGSPMPLYEIWKASGYILVSNYEI